MRLPIPNQQEVEEFAKLYKNKTGKGLALDEAVQAATRVLQFYFLTSWWSTLAEDEETKLKKKLKRKRRTMKRRYMKRHALPLVPSRASAHTNKAPSQP